MATKIAPNVGRPREFDMEQALDGFIRVFRERGYHATSIGDLSRETGLTTGSLYKAFADKNAIFVAALNRYVDRRASELNTILADERNGRDKVRALLRFYADVSHGDEGRKGCLVVGGAIVLGTLDSEIADIVHKSMQRVERLLRDLIRQGQADGSVDATLNAQATSSCLFTMVQGLRVVGKLGQRRSDMSMLVDEAMRLLN
ncbi:TetR/AcrR family transcriptional regulator [Burkholderia sp. AU18528]|uniref:TetR/AcrR family transcriptional regulator n=1 Tax=Burkholderia anthinoferrum TaxID=3090833 RepID=A0ABU5WP08_9BURK|nr:MULTISPECIES: TetR/AcrR family transcriptional regulator [Burkholderia]MEB2504550.1 TetR/AcrR family transcriptional regulator [Burkholderia anthinoferrum]MEB2530218.1 TetR/AcrR family transcriptional regulator [Burkholderia anthinoferrum]MEB2561591.1 TetR/AcrR family transcriptional regulator [Burkholderia anthinoferrum]MEB2580659.1 TetR/AcrR family transcriptional regulator [Burkholderia anthinoferrum]MCA8106674.1 TetR/AcrR family transcriptional regulator [Burkholderia sp. AU36459]